MTVGLGHRGLHAQLYDANKELPAWREKITWLARAERVRRRTPTWRGAVFLDVTFWVPRPASAPKTLDIWPTTRGSGDWDKLARAIGDSLVDAAAIVDDSQICDAHILKRYAVGPDLPKIYVDGRHWPAPGAHIELAKGVAPDPVALKISGGAAPLTVMVNGVPLPPQGSRRTVFFEPDGPGFVRLTVMDARGATDSVSVRLQ